MEKYTSEKNNSSIIKLIDHENTNHGTTEYIITQ
jgi:hypothetical protein